MTRDLIGTVVLATAALGLLQSPALFAATTTAAKDTFPTKAAAQKRATELKCTGVHGSGAAWHPCKDADAYTKAIKMAK